MFVDFFSMIYLHSYMKINDNCIMNNAPPQDIPQQMNGSDCGMFACTFAEFSSRGAPYTFSQGDMPQLRRKAAYEILQGRLLL